uniref:Large ribosomal subunit protein mL64 n=1 Tax=Corvus moneduloides TaxID=1196302 RepID=A0A8U7NZH5_CORMO
MAAPLRRALLALGPARSRLPPPLPPPARPYRAAPLRRRPGPAPGDPEDLRAAARRFGRLGEASGVAVWRLWPSPEQLREAEAEEREWDPPLRDVEAVLDQREREEARRRKERCAGNWPPGSRSSRRRSRPGSPGSRESPAPSAACGGLQRGRGTLGPIAAPPDPGNPDPINPDPIPLCPHSSTS